MAEKEAKARIKINKLLEEAGWRFFDDEQGKTNILLENNVKITKQKLDELGEDFESAKNGFIDFLLLDKQGFPFIVLKQKQKTKTRSSEKNKRASMPSRKIAGSSYLSNGNLHYFGIWSAEIQMLSVNFPPLSLSRVMLLLNPIPSNYSMSRLN